MTTRRLDLHEVERMAAVDPCTRRWPTTTFRSRSRSGKRCVGWSEHQIVEWMEKSASAEPSPDGPHADPVHHHRGSSRCPSSYGTYLTGRGDLCKTARWTNAALTTGWTTTCR